MATPKRICEIIGKGLKNPANINRAEIMNVAAYIAQLENEIMVLHNLIEVVGGNSDETEKSGEGVRE